MVKTTSNLKIFKGLKSFTLLEFECFVLFLLLVYPILHWSIPKIDFFKL